MAVSVMDDYKRRELVMFVLSEVKKYVCYCGRTGMDFSKIHFNDDYWTHVDLKCKDDACDHTRQVEIYYPDELQTDYWMR